LPLDKDRPRFYTISYKAGASRPANFTKGRIIMQNEFSRTQLLLGESAMKHLAGRCVAVFGIGGVGSFTAEALARSGVGRLILVDDDTVCLTNLNRQIIALHSTIGRPKVEVMRERILDINPRCEVVAMQQFYSADTAGEFDLSQCDYIVDAIDTVSAKLALVEHANRIGVPIISSMGAGNKLDPTRLEVADIYDTSICPLARVMRRELRKRGVSALKVVYSREEARRPLSDGAESCNSGAVCPPGTARNGAARRQVPGSVSFVPSVAGLIITSQVIRDMAGPYIPNNP
jgi:tRNA A37 threonylcarbamoyladenosine dehydratase